ncbi:PRC-barrel domain-containing protein [Bacillus alveayuensis]|uniref:PRC-barrel domain-containing protein n=1 Tax=Aeribacillus alveayuensis TaxID=279215 RepID=UPI0005D10C8C|nr:PRC-barrel domain-containing protein [Bacillus alveayuensis]
MRTFSDIKGMPVYHQNGNMIGFVQDLVLSDGCVKGLLLDSKGFFQRHKIILLSDICSFGQDGIIVQNDCHLEEAKARSGYRLQTGKKSLVHKEIVSASGEKLGLLEDVYFSEKQGTIMAYELTDGFFADITVGTKTIPLDKCQANIGKDVIVLE